jgi:hypothetical protein
VPEEGGLTVKARKILEISALKKTGIAGSIPTTPFSAYRFGEASFI